jgi:hypothetical protein
MTLRNEGKVFAGEVLQGLSDARRLPRVRQSRGSAGTNTYNLKLFYGRFHGPPARRKLLYGCYEASL